VIVRTFDGVQALTRPQPQALTKEASVRLYDRAMAYAEVYRRQPNIRIPTDFLARNLAHLTPHVYRRVSDTDRVRLADHQLARWLAKPNPYMTAYRLRETLGGDLGVYLEAFWMKVRYVDADGQDQIGLVPLPPDQMRVEGGLLPTEFVWTVDGKERRFPTSEIVHFSSYNPCDRLRGLSLIETLSTVVAEQDAAMRHREAYWRNSSKQEGVIERALESPSARWSPAQKQAWREQVDERYARPEAAGGWAVLEPGMTFKPASWSAKDSEYVAGEKLRREVSAAEYHIPQPMVGILDHATFSNIKEQHKHLYQDTLGPTLEMVTQEIERQVLIECDDQADVYVEFNIAAKLAGTPEEQTDSLVRATGRAFMTVNEARARVNLPKDDDPESDRIAPQQGGPADATAQPKAGADATTEPPNSAADSSEDGDSSRAVASVLEATRDRQTARLAKLPATDRPAAFVGDLDRWVRELTADLTPHLGAAAAPRAEEETRATLRHLEADAVEARVRALEQRPRVVGTKRTYERNAENGLVVSHIETPIVEVD